MSNVQKGLSTANDAEKKMFRCLACRRLISKAEEKRCPTCGADNSEWRKLKQSDLFDKFHPVWIAVSFVFLAVLALPFIALFAGLSPESFQVLLVAAILAVILSAVIVVAIYVLKFTLRNYDLLRQARKKRRPGFIALAALSLGVSMTLSLVIILLLWTAFPLAPDSEWAIKTLDLETGSSCSLIEERARVRHPVWSPDGHTIVFASDRDGDWDVYAMNEDGTGLTNLTNNNAGDHAPSWSEDGSKITFVSDRYGQWNIFVMDPDGRNPQLLPGESRRATDPAWSPDGKKVVFVLTRPTFSHLLGDQVGLANKLSLVIAVLYEAFVPFLTLALMLVGVKRFTERLDKEFRRPIYLDTDKLVEVALKSVCDHLHICADEDIYTDKNRSGVERFPLPIPLDADSLAETTYKVAKKVRELLKIPDDKKKELLVSSVAGRRERGLKFLFKRRDERRWYWVESELDGEILAFEGTPRLEELQIVSMSRTDSGGLSMRVGRWVESEKKDEETGEFTFVSEEKRYDVEVDEWGYILSLGEQ